MPSTIPHPSFSLPGALLLALLGGCAAAPQPRPPEEVAMAPARPVRQAGGAQPEGAQARKVQQGEASFYHDRFHGRTMANGETFDQGSDSAASKSLPLGTRAQVRNLENGRTATVTIEDRGPFVPGRVVDVSKNTARKLDMLNDGTAPVEIRPLRSNQ